jgi:predicted metalloprotease with PDZ domain
VRSSALAAPAASAAASAMLALASCGPAVPASTRATVPQPRAALAAPATANTAANAGAGGAGTAAAGPAWTYEVAVDPTLDLDVRATFRGPIEGPLVVDSAATAFVSAVEVQEAQSWRKADLGDPKWAAACATTCTVHYRFRLREAAKSVADLDTAILAGGAVFAPPSTWLVRPHRAPAAPASYRFHVTTPAGVRFATGVRAVAAATPGTYEAPIASIDEAAFAAFGALRVGHLADPGIERALAPELPLADDVVTRWLKSEVDAVTGYFAHAPDGYAMIFVAPGTSEDTGGKTLGGGGASLVVRLGKNVKAADLKDDWVVAHELIHVTFPDLDRRYTWFSEGLATYVEPIARERAGLVKREKVWSDMMEGLPQGLPGPDDGGLDGTREWGRTYWGGALYFFLADVRIRERTAGKKGLEDALRAVVATGGNVENMWPIERVLDVGDAATGTRVLHELYDELGSKRGNVDLDAMFRRLGVRRGAVHGTVTFDDAAPLASVRDAIMPKTPRK